ncbi:hypothetical protein CI688_18820 [Shigella sonnei]|nr:hypothetical protein CI688_18820 [Shigella sonnei]
MPQFIFVNHITPSYLISSIFLRSIIVIGSLSLYFKSQPCPPSKASREGANKRGNSSRLTQSFHFFMFEPIFSPVNALNQPI